MNKMERNHVSPIAAIIGTKLANGKAEFEARAPQLKDISPELFYAVYGRKDAAGNWLQKPTHGLFDASIMAAKSVSGMTSFDEIFKSDDDEATGLASISNGKPAPDEVLLVTHISLQYAVAAGTTNADVASATYGLIHDHIANGNIEITQEKRLLLAKQIMEKFQVADHYESTGDTNAVAGTPVTDTMKGVGNVGMVALDNPKWIEPEKKLDVDMKFAAALPNNAAIRIILHGVKPVRV